MACHCSGCSRSKRISTIRQLQPDVCSKRLKPVGSKKYDSKSKKVYLDRYLSARKNLIRDIESYVEGRKRGYEDSWFYSRIKRLGWTGWTAKKYREARAECKKRGINV